MAGKGSGRRPSTVSDEQTALNWAAAFSETWLQRKLREEKEENDRLQESKEDNIGLSRQDS